MKFDLSIFENMDNIPVRFWKYVKIGDGCWLWTGAPDSHGYAQIGVRRVVAPKTTTVRASRISYLLHNGPFNDHWLVCHTCDNSLCVKPSHLFLGTYLDNMRDCVKKGRFGAKGFARGEKHPLAKLTYEMADVIRAQHKDGNSTAKLAAAFGVHPHTIRRVLSNTGFGSWVKE